MPFDFGDVVLVSFPYTNQIASKKRPAVVVGQLSYARFRSDLFLCPLPAKFAHLQGLQNF